MHGLETPPFARLRVTSEALHVHPHFLANSALMILQTAPVSHNTFMGTTGGCPGTCKTADSSGTRLAAMGMVAGLLTYSEYQLLAGSPTVSASSDASSHGAAKADKMS
jgi:hypothetical protein